MISENSTKKTQARAFSWFAFFGNLGIFAGKDTPLRLKPTHVDWITDRIHFCRTFHR